MIPYWTLRCHPRVFKCERVNAETYREWIGLKYCPPSQLGEPVQLLLTLEDMEAVGAHQVVYRSTSLGRREVVSFPRSHVGYLIGLPPDQWFPTLIGTIYEEKLVNRLAALRGSPTLSAICPLDGLWTSLAVQYLPGADNTRALVTRRDDQSLATCDFVYERLSDWSVAAQYSPDDSDELITLYAGDEPVYCTLRSSLPQEAQTGLDLFRSMSSSDNDSRISPRMNPWLPWVAAASTGYNIPASAHDRLASTIVASRDIKLTFKQTNLVAKYCFLSSGVPFFQRSLFAESLFAILSRCLELSRDN